MTSSSNPRFHLLVGWCCLMSSALLFMTVYLTAWHKKQEQSNSTETSPQHDSVKGSPFNPSFNNYIRLIRDNEHWICGDPCESSSLSLNNDSVNITISGLYYIYAQVSFEVQDKNNGKTPKVVLLKNPSPLTQIRKLSEVNSFKSGSVTISRLVKLTNEDSISLNIESGSAKLLPDEYHTYWEIILLSAK